MSRRRALIFVFLAIFFITAPILLAQDPGEVDPDFPFELNDSIVIAIQTIFGLGLMAITQLVKSALKKILKGQWNNLTPGMRHAIMYVATAIIAAGATYLTLTQMALMTLPRMLLYSIYTWGYINQFWKILKENVKKHK